MAKTGATLAFCLMVAIACAPRTSGVTPAALAHSADVEALAGGQVPALVTGPVFMRVQSFRQPPNSTFPSASHTSGFLYQALGTQRLTIQGEAPVDLHAGQGFFQPTIAHTHANPGAEQNLWYFLAVWPSSYRGQPPVNPLAIEEYETEDLPAGTVVPGAYIETLRRVVLDAGGRTRAQSNGGFQVIFVLEGDVSLHRSGSASVRLGIGQGAWLRPGVANQIFLASSSGSTYLDMLITPSGQTFETDINQPA